MTFPFRFALGAFLLAVQVFAQPVAPQNNWTLDFSFPGASNAGRFNVPIAIAMGPGGKIAIGDAGTSMIQVFDASGTPLVRFKAIGSGSGVAVAADGTIFANDFDNNCIRVFAANGTPLRSFGSFGHDDGQFSTPGALAMTPDES